MDLMILDTRYPLLAQNADGSVLAMLHGVVRTFEVKTRMTTRNVKITWQNAKGVMELNDEVEAYRPSGSFKAINADAIAYRIATRLESIDSAYQGSRRPTEGGFDVYILRLSPAEQPSNKVHVGAELHFEPEIDDSGKDLDTYLPTCRLSHTPLSDVYYGLVQNSYYTLADRNWSFGEIGQHVTHYMSWATCSWDDYLRARVQK